MISVLLLGCAGEETGEECSSVSRLPLEGDLAGHAIRPLNGSCRERLVSGQKASNPAQCTSMLGLRRRTRGSNHENRKRLDMDWSEENCTHDRSPQKASDTVSGQRPDTTGQDVS